IAATGGTRGAGMAVLAKALAVCAGTIGGAAACVATGVVPAPLDLGADKTPARTVERTVEPAPPTSAAETPAVVYEPAPATSEPQPTPQHHQSPEASAPAPEPTPEPVPASSGAVEYAPPPEAAAPPPASTAGGSEGGSAAGEFGP
ncbi:MAG TPA: hypothetical protein VF731_11790, partial [Solirubrobacterales bacterium]